MKKFLSLFLVFILLSSVLCTNVTASETVLDSGKCGESLNWELLEDGTLHIFGTGKMYDYVKYVEPSPWYKYRNEPYISEDGKTILNSDGTDYLPTKDYYANNPHNYKIEKIVIDEGVTYIGDWAFYRVCVDTLTIPEGVTETGIFCIRFSPTLKEVNLPDSLKVLDDFAISRNYVLDRINFGKCLEKIGTGGLKDNTSLKSVILPKSCTSINKQLSPAYTGAKIDYAATGLMENNTSLQYVDFGSVTEIPQRSCHSTAIETIAIPDTVEVIGEYAFYNCQKLKSIKIPVSLKQIEAHAFLQCKEITDVYYTGTKNNWNSIDISTNNESLTSAAIHYNALIGDANGDGRITAVDARMILQNAAGTNSISNTKIPILDISGDGKITAVDARYVLQISAGL